MTRLNDARVHRTNGHLEYTFALDLAEFVSLAREWRELGAEVEIFTERIDFRPVIMQGTAARIRMANEFNPEQVLDFALLPICGGQRVGERSELRIIPRHGHAQNDEAVRRVQCEYIVEVKHAFGGTRIVGKQAHEPCAPLFIKMRREAGHEIHLAMDIRFIWIRHAHTVESATESLLHVSDDGRELCQHVHGVPPMMRADSCTS